MCNEDFEIEDYELGYDCDCDENKQLALDIMEILMDTEAIKLSGSNKKNVDDFMKFYETVYDRLEDITCSCEDEEACDVK